MNHRRSFAFFALPALFGAVVLMLAACSAGQGKNASGASSAAPGSSGAAGNHGAAISVMAVAVSEGPLTVVSETAGTVQPVTQSKVAAQIAGTVADIEHQAGAWVDAGETVIQLDDTQLKLSVETARSSLENAKIILSTNEDTTNQANPKLALQVQSAEAALASAQKSYNSAQALFKVGGATSSQVDNAQSQLQMAQANLASARTDLDQNQKAGTQSLALLKNAVRQAETQLKQAEVNLHYATVKAPFAGQISVVSANPGEYVGVNSTAFILVSAAKEVDFNVPPTDAAHLDVGTRVNFVYGGRVFPIEVRQPPSAPVSGMVPMVASVPSSFPIAYGAVGTVGYSLTLARGILIPIASLQTSEDKNYVFVIEEGKATMRTITVIAESGVTAAASGIASGAQIIVNPPPGLLNGSQVQAAQALGSDPAAGKSATSVSGGQAGRP